MKGRARRKWELQGVRVAAAIASFFLVNLVLCIPGQAQQAAPPMVRISAQSTRVWSELLQREPFPYTLPLPFRRPTPVDGTYTKRETKEEPPVPCRRCPDYAPEGGLWKLNLREGVFRIFHPGTGWKNIGSFYIAEDKLMLANDPVCHEGVGIYRWKLEEGQMLLSVIEDKCAIGLRAMNLTGLPWLSCQPSQSGG